MKYILMVLTLLGSAITMANDGNGLFFVENRPNKKLSAIDFRLSTVLDKNLIDTNSVNIKYKTRSHLFYTYGTEIVLNKTRISDEGTALKSNLASQDITFVIVKPKFSLFANLGISPFLGKLNYFNRSFYDFFININLGAGLTSYEKNSAWSETMTSSIYSEVEFETYVDNRTTISLGLRKTYDSLENESNNDYANVFFGIGYKF